MKKQVVTRLVSMLLALLMVLALPAGTLMEVRAADVEASGAAAQTEELTELNPVAVESEGEPVGAEPENQEEAQPADQPEPQQETQSEETAEVKEEAKAEDKAETKEETKAEDKAETKEEAKAEDKAETKEETKAEDKAETKEETKAEDKIEIKEEKQEQKVYLDEDGRYLAPEELNVYITASMDEQSDDLDAPKPEDLEEQYTGIAVFYDYNEQDEEKRLEHPYYFYYKDGKLQAEEALYTAAKGYLELKQAPVAEKTVNAAVAEEQAERLVYVAREVYVDQQAQEHSDYLFAFNRKDEQDNGLFTGTYEKQDYKDGLAEGKEIADKPVRSLAEHVTLTAQVQLDGVALEWNAVSGAAGYRILRGIGSETPEVIANLTDAGAQTYTDQSVKSGQSYTYSVRVYTGSPDAMAQDQDYTKTENWSEAFAAQPVTYLSAPVVTIKTEGKQAVITWTKVEGANQYILKRSENGADWVDYPAVNQLSYQDAKLQNGNRYFYTVQAVNSSAGAASAFYDKRSENQEFAAIYSVPQVTLELKEKGVQIKWTADATATGYRIFRKADGQKTWSEVQNITNGGTRSYFDTGAKNGKKNSYAVRAYYGDPAQLSSLKNYDAKLWSDFKAATLYYLQITEISSVEGGLKIQWNKVPGASGYVICYRTSAKGNWSKAVNVGKKTSYQLTGLKNGEKRYIAIRAYKEKNGKKTYQPWAKTTQPSVYHAMLKVQAGIGAKGVKITWNLDSRAAGYRVYQKVNKKTTVVKDIPASSLKKGAKKASCWVLDENLSNNTYAYTVRAYYGSADVNTAVIKQEPGSWSVFKWVKVKYLKAPEQLQVSVDFAGTRVRWKANKAASGYVIYRKTGANGKWKSVGKVTKGSTNTFIDTSVTNLKSGTEVFYTVRAYFGSKKTLSSYNPAGAGQYYLAKPSNIKVSKPQSNGITIKWSGVAGADYYNVYYRIGTKGAWTLLDSVTGTKFVHKAATDKKDYRYAVRAFAIHNGKIASSTYDKYGISNAIMWNGSERNAWVKKKGNIYYVDGNGVCLTGWQYLKYNGKTYKYYFDKKTAALVTNMYSYLGEKCRYYKTQVEVYLNDDDNYPGHVTVLLYDKDTDSFCIPAVCFRCIGNLKTTWKHSGYDYAYLRPGAGAESFFQIVPGGAYERYALRINGSPSFFHSVLYDSPNTYDLDTYSYNSMIRNNNNSVACIRCQAIYVYLLTDIMKNGYGKNHHVVVNIHHYEKDVGPFGIPQVKHINSNYDPSDPAATGKFFYATKLKEDNRWIKAEAGASPWEWY